MVGLKTRFSAQQEANFFVLPHASEPIHDGTGASSARTAVVEDFGSRRIQEIRDIRVSWFRGNLWFRGIRVEG